MAVDADRLADIADFIGEHHLDGMPAVVAVLHHFCCFDIGADERRIHFFIQLCQDFPGLSIGLADDGLGRMVIVVDGGSFTQEFGVDADAEVHAGLFAGAGFQRRDDLRAHGARQHRAAHHDHMEGALVAQRGADFLAYLAYMAHIEIAVDLGRRADAYERNARIENGFPRIARCPQQSCADRVGNHVADVFLDDGRDALIDQVNLGRVGIDADDGVAVGSEAAGGNGADITQAKNAYLHWSTFYRRKIKKRISFIGS